MIWLNTLIALILPFVPKSLVGIVAKQYIAGETLEQAVARTRELNRNGMGATLDLLGEDPIDKASCTRAVETYEAVIRKIREKKLSAGISLKPSHMGLKLDPVFCLENIRHLVAFAGRYGIFVRIDMEDASLCDATIRLFLELAEAHDNVGIVMQAYLRRAIDDINTMAGCRANVRLCKGAYYWETRDTVYKDGEIVNQSYAYLLEKLLRADCFTAIATHDERLVFQALMIIDRLNVPKGRYEFQMLYGVEEELRRILVSQGRPVRVYVPFGKEWFAYSIRRLKENPRMVGYILGNAGNLFRALMGRL